VPTDTPTDEPTATDMPSDTPIPSDTPTDEPTATDTPSVTPSATATATNTHTPVPSDTPIPSDTPTDEPSDTPVPTDTPTDEPTEIAAVVVATDSPVPSDTPIASDTPTDEPTEVALVSIPTDEPTVAPSEQVIILPETAIPTEPITAETVPVDDDSGGFAIPVEALIGISILVIVLGYIFLFWRGLVAADRYRDGFIIEECPVCKRGGLTVDEKPGRLLGIPQTRRTVRCDVCRSVLRETGAGRWRYAVDRIENPTMYDRFNGKEITDDELVRLSGSPPKGSARPTNPEFVDEDNPDASGS
jgi:hypothetical protein